LRHIQKAWMFWSSSTVALKCWIIWSFLKSTSMQRVLFVVVWNGFHTNEFPFYPVAILWEQLWQTQPRHYPW
jgi:hypothetical protein